MASNPSDYSNPEIPTSQRDFWVLYWHDRNEWKERLEEITESQADDRDAVLKVIDKWEKWTKEHDTNLQANLSVLTRHDEKIDSLEKKVNTWSLTNSIATIGAFLTALFMKGS